MRSRLRLCILASLLVANAFACAHHPARMSRVRMLMAQEDYSRALEEMEQAGGSEDDVLYLLERGLLLHYAGQYDQSNQVFERAEVLSEDLYTKSLSREAASLLTSDLLLKYVPRPFEQVLINYFRALNYIFSDLREDALVECRKAGDKLALYSEEDKRPYRRDAFLQYLSGILYEWDGQVNDAFISYRNAFGDYRTYGELFGISHPPHLACDLIRTAQALGFSEEEAKIDSILRAGCKSEAYRPQLAKVVVFVEYGFVPVRQEWGLNIPILESEAKHAGQSPYDFSLGATSRLYGHSFEPDEIAYFLRVALPRYPQLKQAPIAPSIYLDSLYITPAMSEDIFALAKTELDQDMPKIFVKTLARAIIKYKATDKAGDKWGDAIGKIVNVATAATEHADLRGWLSLPRAIYVATAYVEPGRHRIGILPSQPADHAEGRFQEVEIVAGAGSTNFVRFRTY